MAGRHQPTELAGIAVGEGGGGSQCALVLGQHVASPPTQHGVAELTEVLGPGVAQ